MYQIENHDLVVIYSVFVYVSTVNWMHEEGRMCNVSYVVSQWCVSVKRRNQAHHKSPLRITVFEKKAGSTQDDIHGTVIEMIVRRTHVIYGNPTSPARTRFSGNLKMTGCFFLFVTLALDNRSLNSFSIHPCTDLAAVPICNRMQTKKLLLILLMQHKQIHV